MANPYAANIVAKSKNVVTLDKRTKEPFNPYAFGAEGKSGNRRVASKERTFDGNGTLNASTNKEALETIRDVLNMSADGVFETEQGIKVNASADVDADALIQQAFSDPSSEGFHRAGQALLNPIKEVIDYESISGKIWAPRNVKPGEQVRYDRDIYVMGWVIGDDGQTPQSQVGGQYIHPPEFEVTAYPSFELKDQYRAQYDLLARAQDKARQAMEYQIDLASMNLLQAGGNASNPTTFFAALNLAALEGLRYQIERHRLVCHAYIINRQEVSDLVNVLTAQVDPVTQRELIMTGYIGNVLNAAVITTAGTNTYEVLDPGDVVAITAPEYLGGMATRVDPMSEPVTEFNEGRPRRGWYWYMLTALALINARGVALGQKT